jgi:hypothetical protein
VQHEPEAALKRLYHGRLCNQWHGFLQLLKHSRLHHDVSCLESVQNYMPALPLIPPTRVEDGIATDVVRVQGAELI